MSTDTKLAVIVFSDIADYTKLSSESQSSAVALVKQHESDAKELIKKYNGTLLKNLGDGLLFKFDSTRQSVLFSIELQKLEKPYKLRISIHQGDVISEESDVYGDGVNIASRINSYSPEEGIVLSKSVADDVNNEKDILVLNIGEFYLKGQNSPFTLYVIYNDGINTKQKIVTRNPWGKTTRIYKDNHGIRQYSSLSLLFYLSWIVLKAIGGFTHYLFYFYIYTFIFRFLNLEVYATNFIDTYLHINSSSFSYILGFIGLITGLRHSGCEINFSTMEVKLSITKKTFLKINQMRYNLMILFWGKNYMRK